MSISGGISVSAPGFSLSGGVSVQGPGFSLRIGGGFLSASPVPQAPPAVYMLVIRQPTGAKQYAAQPYIFPISPTSLRKQWMSMATIYAIAGSAKQLGVQNLADQYGQAPPLFMIEGTTGWETHAVDGGQLTGLQSMQALEQFFATYAQLNQQQIATQQSDLYTMDFYDYFRNEFWEVVPVGEQEIRQDQQRPILCFYSIKLVGIRNLAAPTSDGTPNPLVSTLQQGPNQGSVNLRAQIGLIQSSYASVTVGASLKVGGSITL